MSELTDALNRAMAEQREKKNRDHDAWRRRFETEMAQVKSFTRPRSTGAAFSPTLATATYAARNVGWTVDASAAERYAKTITRAGAQ